MTVVHPHPHPLAQQVVEPINPQILAKFGKVRVEDWDDRISGSTVAEHVSRGSKIWYGAYQDARDAVGVSPASPITAVVRSHSVRTGSVVLLHDDWLRTAEQQEQAS